MLVDRGASAAKTRTDEQSHAEQPTFARVEAEIMDHLQRVAEAFTATSSTATSSTATSSTATSSTATSSTATSSTATSSTATTADPAPADLEGERALLLQIAAQVEAALEDDAPVSVIFVSRLAGRLRREAAELGFRTPSS